MRLTSMTSPLPPPRSASSPACARPMRTSATMLATTGELNALSHRELADLGLSRLSVEDVARQAVYGK